jgi:hypothetical protein
MRKKGKPIKNTFWELIAKHKEDYDIRVSASSSKRSAKRITILVSNAFLSCIGEVNGTDYLFHWIQDLEAELYKACKEQGLDCDGLEMESVDRTYICKNKKSPLYGRKIKATAFDNHRINTTIVGDTPKARLFAEIVTDFLTLEGGEKDEEFSGNNPRERFVGTFEYQERDALPTQETGIPLRGTFKDPQSVSR